MDIKTNTSTTFTHYLRLSIRYIMPVVFLCCSGLVMAESLPPPAKSNATKNNIIPIKINANHQFVDLQKDIVTFTGNVIITRANATMRADKVIVVRKNNQPNTIDSYGTPAYFSDTLDSGKKINGHANKIHYDIPKGTVLLTDDAYVEQEGSSIKGQHITYLVKEQKISAQGGKSGRINTVITPSDFNEK